MQVRIGSRSTVQVERGEHGAFWDAVSRGAWEPSTLSLLEQMVGSDTVFIDVGAWIGPTTLLAAGNARQVLAFEPDPVAFRILTENLHLNPALNNVEVRNEAVGSRPGRVRLGVRTRAGDSCSSILLGDGSESWEVPIVSLIDVISEFPPGEPMVIKIDIEGYEFEMPDVLRAAVIEHDASILLSLHPTFFGIRLAQRLRGTGPFRRIGRSVLKRAGRVRGYREVMKFARALGEDVEVLDTNLQPVSLQGQAARILIGNEVTPGELVVLRRR